MNLRSKMKERAERLLFPRFFLGMDFGSDDFGVVTKLRLAEGKYEIFSIEYYDGKRKTKSCGRERND